MRESQVVEFKEVWHDESPCEPTGLMVIFKAKMPTALTCQENAPDTTQETTQETAQEKNLRLLHGEYRAAYGTALLERLSQALGKGFFTRSLRQLRALYLHRKGIRQTLSAELDVISSGECNELLRQIDTQLATDRSQAVHKDMALRHGKGLGQCANTSMCKFCTFLTEADHG